MTAPDPFPALAGRLRDFIRRHAGASAAAEAEFDQLALAIFRAQFEHVAPFRRLCAARQVTPERVAAWPEIPAVPTSAFKELELTSLPASDRAAVFHSSGTTGQIPSRHFHNADSLELYADSLRPWFQRNVLPGFSAARASEADPRPRCLMLTPPPAAAPHSSLVRMFDIVRRDFGAVESFFTGATDATGAWTLDLEATLRALREAAAGSQPVLVLGTAFSFVHLLDHCAAAHIQFTLPGGSRVLETGGYKGRSRTLPRPELHALLTSTLGVPAPYILCEYGMSELSSQAYAGGGADRVFQFPPWARARVISPETGREVAEGETGLLRVLDLANLRSVMAIQTEDLARRRGRGFELLGRAPQSEPRGCSLLAAHNA